MFPPTQLFYFLKSQTYKSVDISLKTVNRIILIYFYNILHLLRGTYFFQINVKCSQICFVFALKVYKRVM